MLEDAAKGLEPQTRKLFEVCRMRKIPIFTFTNKMAGRAASPLPCWMKSNRNWASPWAVNWPIGSGGSSAV